MARRLPGCFHLAIALFTMTAALVLSSPCASAKDEKTTTLTLNLPIPPIHTRWNQAIKPWIEELEKRTNGRLKVKPYFAEALSPQKENYESVVKGIADMSECAMNVKPGLFPLNEQIFNCTPPSLHLTSGSKVLRGLHREFPKFGEELKDVKLLFLHANAPGTGVATSKKPIRSVEDCRGVKINVIGMGMMNEKCKALGFSVVGMPLSDVYMAVDKGVIDGSMSAYELMLSRRWGDVIKHSTNITLTTTPFYMVMNKSVWNRLPKDIQKIIDEMSGDYALDLFDRYWLSVDKEAKERWEAQMGGQSHWFSREEFAVADKLVEPSVQKWAEGMEKKGYPAAKIVARFRELCKEHSVPWTEWKY